MSKKINIEMLVKTALFVALIVVGGFIKIPIPYVPISLQTFFTILAGIMLGKKYGTISVAIYVILGLIGLPVFTSGGGISYVLTPSFGYLIGMILGAFVAGCIVEKAQSMKFAVAIKATTIASLIVYIIGVPYFWAIANLYLGSNLAVKTILWSGFVITLPGDIIKILLASIFVDRVKNIKLFQINKDE